MPPPDIHPREMKTYVHTKIDTQMFTAALSTVVKKKKETTQVHTNTRNVVQELGPGWGVKGE